MKAIILAAGLGTRLKPLTDSVPKALVKIDNKTLLEYAIEKLIKNGVNEFVINVHHFSQLVKDFVQTLNYPNICIKISDETDLLLDTGGGIKKAASYFNDNDPFIVYNVDVFTDLNLKEMMKYHLQKKAMVTLAVSDRKTSRYFLFDDNLMLKGWKNEAKGEILPNGLSEKNLSKLAFSGIHIISPEFMNALEKEGRFSITTEYVFLCNKYSIYGFDHTGVKWLDLGKLDALKEGEIFIKQKKELI